MNLKLMEYLIGIKGIIICMKMQNQRRKKRKKEKGNGPKMIRNKSWVFFFLIFQDMRKGNLDKLYMHINWMMYEYKQG